MITHIDESAIIVSEAQVWSAQRQERVKLVFPTLDEVVPFGQCRPYYNISQRVANETVVVIQTLL